MNIKTLRLRDDRQVGYREYGTPDGTPVLYFPGLPCLSFLPSYWAETVPELDIRLITLERPGYGVSDFQPDRRLLDWPDDVAGIAEALEIDRFGVLGFSGGSCA